MGKQDAVFTETLVSIQNKLNPLARTFSKLIHQPAVECVSEALERTILRPSVTLAATWTAFITGLIFYLTARFYGFTLAGSEMLLALIGGGVLGLTLELLWRVIRNKINNR